MLIAKKECCFNLVRFGMVLKLRFVFMFCKFCSRKMDFCVWEIGNSEEIAKFVSDNQSHFFYVMKHHLSVIWVAIWGTSKIPLVGPYISVGLGVAKAVWGDELIYDHIDF